MTREQILADNLVRLLREKGESKSWLGKTTGLGVTAIFQMLTDPSKDSYRYPRADRLKKIADVLGVPIEELIMPGKTRRGVRVIALLGSEGAADIADDNEYAPVPMGYNQEQADTEGIYAIRTGKGIRYPEGWYLYFKPGVRTESGIRSGDVVMCKEDGKVHLREVQIHEHDYVIILKDLVSDSTIARHISEMIMVDLMIFARRI